MGYLSDSRSHLVGQLVGRFGLFATMLVAGQGCTPFDPEIPNGSFRCGPDNACPSGHTCVSGQCASAGGGDRPDGGTNSGCQSEGAPLEPNDTLANAFVTPVARTMNTFELADVAVCPASDIDMYKVDVAVNNTNLVVEVTFSPSGPALSMEVQTSNGTVITRGQVIEGGLRATVPNLAQGFYYVSVSASGPTGNGYRVRFTASQ